MVRRRAPRRADECGEYRRWMIVLAAGLVAALLAAQCQLQWNFIPPPQRGGK